MLGTFIKETIIQILMLFICEDEITQPNAKGEANVVQFCTDCTIAFV